MKKKDETLAERVDKSKCSSERVAHRASVAAVNDGKECVSAVSRFSQVRDGLHSACLCGEWYKAIHLIALPVQTGQSSTNRTYDTNHAKPPRSIMDTSSMCKGTDKSHAFQVEFP